MFTGSALLYTIRLALARRPISGVESRAMQTTGRPVNIRSPRYRNMKLNNETSG
jgi:hypothetical protein